MYLRIWIVTALAALFGGGALAAPSTDLWLVRLERGADWVEGQPDEEQPFAGETRETLRQLIEKGVVVLIGRSEGAGILVLRSIDEERALDFAGSLPTVRNDVHRYSVAPFELFHASDLKGLAKPPR